MSILGKPRPRFVTLSTREEGEWLWEDEAPTIDAVKEALCQLGNVKTLILSRAVVKLCLLALERGARADENSQGLPQLQTLIIHSRFSSDISEFDNLRALLPIVQKRKAAGFP